LLEEMMQEREAFVDDSKDDAVALKACTVTSVRIHNPQLKA